MSNLDDAKKYYKDLLLYQYINCPKALATIELLSENALCDLLPLDLNNAFELETAEGPQLDILGEYIGFNRNIRIDINRIYMSFEDSDTPYTDLYGLTDYDNNINNQAYMYNYIDAIGAIYTLNDSEYRFLLKLKIFTNKSNHSTGEINNFIYSEYQNLIYLIDNYNMTIMYLVNSTISKLIGMARDNYILPKPMGVTLQLIQFDDLALLFSLSLDSEIGLTDYDNNINDNSYFLDYGDEF